MAETSPMWSDGAFFDPPERDYTAPESDNIRVYLRVRPRTPAEVDAGEPGGQVTPVTAKCCELSQGSRTGRYYFDHVFGEASNQEEVFRASVLPLVHSLVQGTSALVFAYGVTNSGKTYTIHGPEGHGGEAEGVLPRIFRSAFTMLDLLQAPEGREQDVVREFGNFDNFEVIQRGFDPTAAYAVVFSALEIYNEKLVDLLDLRGAGASLGKDLKMVEEGGEMVVKGLQELEVKNVAEALGHLRAARSRIQMGQTMCNADSSRSHSAFTISLCKSAGAYGIMDVVAKLIVCDLAGSERANRTENTGARLKEAATINQSLVVLGRCLQVLRWNQSHPAPQRRVVPFRESKITRLFQSSLTGNGKAVMVVNVSPCNKDVEETMHALQYSSIAKEVVNTPTPVAPKRKMQVGMDGQAMTLPKALGEIQALSAQLAESQATAAAREVELRQSLSKQWAASLQALQQAMWQQEDEVEQQSRHTTAELARLQELVFTRRLEQVVGVRGLMSPARQDVTMVDAEEDNTEVWRNGRYHELERRLSVLTAELGQERKKHHGLAQELLEAKRALALREEECRLGQARHTAMLENSIASLESSNVRLQCEVDALRKERAEWQQGRHSADRAQPSPTCNVDAAAQDLAAKDKLLQALRDRVENLESALRMEEGIKLNSKKTIDSLTVANSHAANTIKTQQEISEKQKVELQQAVLAQRRAQEEAAALRAERAALLQQHAAGQAFARPPTATVAVDTADLRPPEMRYQSPPSYHSTLGDMSRSAPVRSPRMPGRPGSTLRSTVISNALHASRSPRRAGSPVAGSAANSRPASPTPDYLRGAGRPAGLAERLRQASPLDRFRGVECRGGAYQDRLFTASAPRVRAGTPCDEARGMASPERRLTPENRRTPPRAGSPVAPRKPSATTAPPAPPVRTRARSRATPVPSDAEGPAGEPMDVSSGRSSHRTSFAAKRTSGDLQLDGDEAEKRRRRGASKTKGAAGARTRAP